MKRISLYFLIFGLPLTAAAQLSDNFADGDFSADPAWSGDAARFAVTNGELQLNDAAPGGNNTAYLYVPAATSTDNATTWEFLARLEFAPSTSNFARVYLASSSPDLSSDLNGYYIKVGGISGDADALELYRQDGATSVMLLGGTAGAVGLDPALARVRVTRTTSGEWALFADYTGGTDYMPEGTVQDATYPSGAYFGVYCRYTSTRAQSFFFDDVYVNPLFVDQTPPQILSASATGATQLRVQFNEALEAGVASQTARYAVDNGIGAPQTAAPDAANPTVVVLTLASPLTNLVTYTLTVNGLSDQSGNVAGEQTVDFTFLNVEDPIPGDLVITEIMADPTPVVGLPSAEFLELHNRSDKVIQLENLQLAAGGSPRLLPEKVILPGAYLILCDDTDAADFTAFGDVLALTSFPQLTNGGSEVSLSGVSGELLWRTRFALDWYADNNKSDGGWTLELIQPEGPYDCRGNWRASVNPKGGTPGQPNSLLGTALETQGPQLLTAFPENTSEALLVFDEALDPVTAEDPDQYSVDGGLSVVDAFIEDDEKRTIRLIFSGTFQSGQVYNLTLDPTIADCLGNQLGQTGSARLGLSEPMEAGDLVINEVLFYPEVGGVDFVEVYNRSDKTLNLKGLQVVNNYISGSNRSKTLTSDYLLFPGELAAITSDPLDILARYDVPRPQALIANDLPTLSSDIGNVNLVSPAFVTVDSFDYDKDFHSPLLDDQRGVSLERINPDSPTQGPGNWHSAAGTKGFATPTGVNSQFFALEGAGESVISLPNPRFSPDGDGIEDFLLLEYETEQPDYLANIQVFDAEGRLVWRIARNELLAQSGQFKWDGYTLEGSKARIGIYIIWIELHTPDGDVIHQKEPCVVAGRLD
ncbi:MAG TPA: Ig-like domain-containing protein [Flavilitoribacter sp.]|nr:Ig-like domain-containing protein [Flavilitoribacter sp.]HMQ88599.1 Ig-like domain-containing protein [Flavilitoribacter sp.]